MGLAVKSDNVYTYADYLSWPENESWELIDGVPVDMSPAPGRKHQKILGEMYRQVSNFLVGKTCDVYPAPFDVRFGREGETDEHIKTVLQPDISVICDLSKLDDNGCLGAPDLVIEIVSPATVRKDMREKFAIYEKYGVKEYWIVHPVDQTVMIFSLGSDGKYGRPGIYVTGDKLETPLFPGLVIDLGTVFPVSEPAHSGPAA